MDIEYAKSLSYEVIRRLYKTSLERQGLGRNTVGTVTGDTFYLWNNESKDAFWDVVAADDFETVARRALTDSLTSHSSGNVNGLVNGYASNLRKFRSFIFEEQVIPEKDDATALKEFLIDTDCLDRIIRCAS